MNGAYENALKKSFMSQPEQKDMPLDKFYKESSYPSVDFSKGSLAEQEVAPEVTDVVGQKVASTDMGSQEMAQKLAPSAESKVAGAGADALIMFGDPSMKALGLGLKTAQGISDAKQQQKMNEYQAEVKRIQARQEALNKLSQIGQGLKA